MKTDREIFFDRAAVQWDEEHNTPAERERTGVFARRYLAAGEGERVLDVGCGTGRLTPFLTEMTGPRGLAVGLDISEAMLRIPRARYRAANVGYIRGDGHWLPFLSGSFDMVVCFAFFPHLERPLEAMAGFFRVLRPGGRLVAAHQMNREELNGLHARVAGPVRGDVLPSLDVMRGIFEGVGFERVEGVEASGLYWVRGYRGRGE